MIKRIPGFQPPISHLFGLANGVLDPHFFLRACAEFATFEVDLSFDDLWKFSLCPEAILTVSLNTESTGKTLPNGSPENPQESVINAILPFCWWETYTKSDHPNLESWTQERAAFDRCYSDSLTEAIELLGPPQIQGVDTDENEHHYSIWRGDTGLLILQQSAYDPQFGYDVNFWIQPWFGAAPQPTSPLIDWLCKLWSDI